jgi:hypothetical protein
MSGGILSDQIGELEGWRVTIVVATFCGPAYLDDRRCVQMEVCTDDGSAIARLTRQDAIDLARLLARATGMRVRKAAKNAR